MRSLVNYSLVLLVGLILGYALRSILVSSNEASAQTSAKDWSTNSKSLVSCELTNDQIDHLSIRIAPQVVAQLAKSGLNGFSPDPKVVATQEASIQKAKLDQEEAITKATQLIDQMITNRKITPQGMSEVFRLLQQTGQADQSFKLMARITAAVNRGDLTPEEAGIALPPTAPNN